MSKYTDTKAWQDYLKLAENRPELFYNDGHLDILFDESVINEYYEKHRKLLGMVYESDWHHMVVDVVKDRQGQIYAYERVIPKAVGQSVVIVPVYQGRYLLLKQYRHALRGLQTAFVRGYGEDHICAKENALKELKEEIGAVCTQITPIGTIASNSGLSAERTEVFVAEIESYQFLETEGIEAVEEIEKNVLDQWIATGVVDDGFTLGAMALMDRLDISR